MTDKPNFLLILTDDQGWDDLGIHGNTILETPRLDALARESVQFDQFYVAPVCAPTRAALLTGRHNLRTGVSHVHGGKDFVHLDETMIGEVMQRAGYRTGMWGKWHSGKTNGYFPWERGFDEAYMAQLYKHKDNRGILNGEQREHEGWTTVTITDYAIDFIEQNKDRPFFAFVPHLTCHAPLAAPEDLIAKYEAKGLSHNLATLYGMLDLLDTQVGRLLDKLDELGLAENTVVMFLSDNGPAYNGDTLTDEDRAIRYVSGYKSHKGSMWENGIKAPLFVRLRGTFAPGHVNRLADVTDLFPTIAGWAGAQLEGDHLPLDGRSVVPYLLGQQDALDDKTLFVYADRGWDPEDSGTPIEYDPIAPEARHALDPDTQAITIRGERYKLLLNPDSARGTVDTKDGYALVDVREDPLENTNVISGQSELADRMKTGLREWFEDIRDGDHSFTAPVFFARRSHGETVIPAYAPMRIAGNLRNAVHYLADWHAPGDFADYEIEVEDAGPYEVLLSFEKTDDRAISLQAAVNETRVAAAIAGNATSVSLGTLELPCGRHELRLSVLDADENGEGAIISRMDTIILRSGSSHATTSRDTVRPSIPDGSESCEVRAGG